MIETYDLTCGRCKLKSNKELVEKLNMEVIVCLWCGYRLDKKRN